MEGRLRPLGWREVEIVDEDLGRSASGNVTGSGFERMVAQVCLREIGVVCAGRAGRRPRLGPDDPQRFEEALLRGPRAWAYTTEPWNTLRVADLIEEPFQMRQ